MFLAKDYDIMIENLQAKYIWSPHYWFATVGESELDQDLNLLLKKEIAWWEKERSQSRPF